MTAPPRMEGVLPVLSVRIDTELDIVTARQRARHLGALLGFLQQDQARIATAVSEIARNAVQQGGGAKLDFAVDLHSSPQLLWMQVGTPAALIADPEPDAPPAGAVNTTGIIATRRLMDRFAIVSIPGDGVSVRFAKLIPPAERPWQPADLGRMAGELAAEHPPGALEELQRQNQDLLMALQAQRARELELERLTSELSETNRGVVALYAELDEKAAALRRADEIKSRFLSHASHEFRTPVNSVLALTGLLLRRTDGELTSEQEKQVTYIRQAAENLAEIVNDLLDLAKVEAGKTEVHVARVNVATLLGAVRALMRPLVTNEAVRLVIHDPPADLEIETDEGKLSQILRNLVSNALKFTAQGEVRVGAQVQPGGIIAFTVEDTGVGIAPQHLDEVFQEFVQVNNPIQRKVKGTGLGLSLSRRLAGLLGGSIEVNSQLGVGSTFIVKLPLSLAVEEHAPPPDAGAILIIDDEEADRYVTRQLLRGTARVILESSNAAEGAERARFERPAIIFLDLIMPGRTGFDVLDDLKADPATADIPVVIHSSKALSDSDLNRLAGRQCAILPKSGDRRETLSLIREILADPGLFAGEPEFENHA